MLTTIQTQLNLYGYPILMILGNIGNIFIIILFSRHRQNACSIYILSLAIINDVYLTYNAILQMFPLYYGDQYVHLLYVKYVIILDMFLDKLLKQCLS